MRALALVGAIVAIGVALRLALAFGYAGNFDARSFEIVAEIMKRGGNVYAETTRYNYTPVWAVLLHALDGVATFSSLPLQAVERTFLTVIDLVDALLIATIGARQLGRPWIQGFAMYMLNPVAILIVGAHGQFENLAALPLLAALAIGERQGRIVTWALGTLSLLIKHVLAFQVWLLYWYAYRPAARVTAIVLAAAAFCATFLPYLPGGTGGIVANVLGYGGLRGSYGFGSVVPPAAAVVLFLTVMITLPLAAERWRLRLVAAARLSAVTLIAFIFGIGEQYFTIPVLFGSAAGGRWYWLYTLVATAFLLSSFENVHVLSLPRVWNAVWLVALLWSGAEILRATRRGGATARGRES